MLSSRTLVVRIESGVSKLGLTPPPRIRRHSFFRRRAECIAEKCPGPPGRQNAKNTKVLNRTRLFLVKPGRRCSREGPGYQLDLSQPFGGQSALTFSVAMSTVALRTLIFVFGKRLFGPFSAAGSQQSVFNTLLVDRSLRTIDLTHQVVSQQNDLVFRRGFLGSIAFALRKNCFFGPPGGQSGRDTSFRKRRAELSSRGLADVANDRGVVKIGSTHHSDRKKRGVLVHLVLSTCCWRPLCVGRTLLFGPFCARGCRERESIRKAVWKIVVHDRSSTQRRVQRAQ